MKLFRRALSALTRGRRAGSTRMVVAGMATMPTRADTFPAAFDSIVNQVDRLYLYLDGHAVVPERANGHPRVVAIFSHDVPDLHANGKFLGVSLAPVPCLYLGVDDDIAYPPNYVRSLRAGLDAYGRRAVVGYHGATFLQPFVSFQQSREAHWFATKLARTRTVDLLGTGTVMFDTAVLRFDVRRWPFVNMLDLSLAIEATKAKLPLVCLARDDAFIRPLESSQPDSIFAARKRDDSRHTTLARKLLALRNPTRVKPAPPSPEIFAAHGVVDGYQKDLFQHRNLLEAAHFSAALQSMEKFVPLSAALEGRGKALTIDDGTAAAGRAALLARRFGHAVTLFINPWHVDDGRAYSFSLLNALLDRAVGADFRWQGRQFNLVTLDGKSELRAAVKRALRGHVRPQQNYELIEDIRASLAIHRLDIPDYLRCLSLQDLQQLRDAGVELENHSWSHLDPAAHTSDQLVAEFQRAREWLRDALGVSSKYFASPFGEFLPPREFLRQNETVAFLLDDRHDSGVVDEAIVNRINLQVTSPE